MKNICFFFEIHQPFFLKRYRFFDIGADHYYFDEFQSEDHIRDYAMRSYLPANAAILEMIKSSDKRFKCAFSISGVTLELFEQYAPEVIDSFQELAKTGCVEFVVEPYSHSLAAVFSENEFEKQLKAQTRKIETLFGKKPTAFCNSEMIYSDEIGDLAYRLGYKTVLIDEARQIMGWKSPNYVYHHATNAKQKILVRNFAMSDSIAFRFSDHSWLEFPLTAEKYLDWVNLTPEGENLINLFFGYEAFGIYNTRESGIFAFLKALVEQATERKIAFITPTEAVKTMETAGSLSVQYPISWSGNEKNLAPWAGNDLQQEALHKLYAATERVHLCQDKPIAHDWQMLQCADYFRYMSHRDTFNSPYESPYDAFTNYMNVLADFLKRVNEQYPETIENEELSELLTTIINQDKEIECLQQEVAKLRKKK